MKLHYTNILLFSLPLNIFLTSCHDARKKKCKEQCDIEIQQIILKDKIEKTLAEHFCTLEMNISTYDIPSCVCEKSLADKVEKGGITEAAIAEAITEGEVVGEAVDIKAGIAKGIQLVNSKCGVSTLGDKGLESFFTATNYTDSSLIS
ncbi:rifin PIR protein, putative [Plasmodium gaboni]|uniref:Rifin PIR protein, putative n=1 Tax=Plasmodium gaboni TaxID=647221 RepID=A0ABY1UW84_9APIC|nr:rifin PIR protein, putative [Plasmodium gaboni]